MARQNQIERLRFFFFLLLIIPPSLSAQLPAFPGAEGAGKYTTGGRGGIVLEVTNLNNSGEGSLREAIDNDSPRTVVFRVSGTIVLESDLKINEPNITIAGQTAPGDGICLRGYPLIVKDNNVIIRHMRFRLGDESGDDDDAIGGRNNENIIIDHCSASWSVDETMSFYENDSLTVQWCIISESLYMSHHEKGAHGYGGIWGGTDVSFHHNLFAHHSSRNPRFSGGGSSDATINMDFRNNVIYNWGFNSSYGGAGATINMVANYYKSGPATLDDVKDRIVSPNDANGSWYIEENFVEGFPEITSDNWAGGVQGEYAIPSMIRVYEPLPFVPVTTQTAEEAYDAVLLGAGAIFPARDAIDTRIIDEVANGYATYDGTQYEINEDLPDTSINRGIIDSQDDVGGWPELQSLPAPTDTDHDGMPDDWEIAHGLNPDDPEDRNTQSSSGYTMLEDYLNELTPLRIDREGHHKPFSFRLHQNYPNPFNSSTIIRFSLEHRATVNLKIYDMLGRQVKQLVQGNLPAGEHDLHWYASNDLGSPVASGLYIILLRSDDEQQLLKTLLIR